MDLHEYLRAIRKRWWLVVLVVVLGAGVGVAGLETATPSYVSSVTFYVATSATASGGSTAAFSADQFAQHRATSYAELLSSGTVALKVLQQGGIDLLPGQVAAEISGAVDINTVLLTAAVRDPNKNRALKISQALADSFPGVVATLDSKVSQDASVSLTVVSGPTIPGRPVSPRPSLYLGLGVLAGLLLGLFVAVARERFDTSVRSDEALESVSDLPILGSIPMDTTARTTPLVWGDRARSQRAEAYRRLRTNLQFVDVDNPIRTIVITSSVAEEGKSATSANLALSFAETGRRVVLVEADLRRPKVADYFEVERAVGLTNVLAGQVDLVHVLQPWGNTGLYVLPSGSIPPNPSELLGSRNMVDLLERLKTRFDLIVIDTPPVLPVTDAAVAAVNADGVVFVVRHGRTKRAQVAAALQQLKAVDARVLGLVPNMRPAKRGGRYGRYDDYSTYETTAGTTGTIDVNADLTAARPASRIRRPDGASVNGSARAESPPGLTPDGVSEAPRTAP